ncbi:MAG: hypothetical protein QW666_01000 [Candidatus Woesearchaeota archaeon]
MSNEVMPDLGKILLAGLVVLTLLCILRDAGFTGFSVAELPVPVYYGPEQFFVQENGKLTLDLNNYFSEEGLQYFIEAPEGLNTQLLKNILFIDPEQAGEYEITVHASNLQNIAQQKLIIKVMNLQPNRQGCSCQH